MKITRKFDLIIYKLLVNIFKSFLHTKPLFLYALKQIIDQLVVDAEKNVTIPNYDVWLKYAEKKPIIKE